MSRFLRQGDFQDTLLVVVLLLSIIFSFIGSFNFVHSQDGTYGCVDPNASNYDSSAYYDDGSCEYLEGCTDLYASNYNSDAYTDDGSCEYVGCTDMRADIFNPYASDDDGSCTYGSFCTSFNVNSSDDYSGYTSYEEDYIFYQSQCSEVPGCTEVSACNYSPLANVNDGSCDYSCAGCTDQAACNYDSEALLNNDSCEYSSCYGCTDTNAENYDANASADDGSCEYWQYSSYVIGCTDVTYLNYNPYAEVDDSTCSNETSGHSGTSSVESLKDLAENIEGQQTSVLSGKYSSLFYDNSGDPHANMYDDVCPDLVGGQAAIPSGYDESCNQVDLCDNIDGVQDSVPEGFNYNNGSCHLSVSCVGTPNVALVGEEVTYTAYSACENVEGGNIQYTWHAPVTVDSKSITVTLEEEGNHAGVVTATGCGGENTAQCIIQAYDGACEEVATSTTGLINYCSMIFDANGDANGDYGEAELRTILGDAMYDEVRDAQIWHASTTGQNLAVHGVFSLDLGETIPSPSAVEVCSVAENGCQTIYDSESALLDATCIFSPMCHHVPEHTFIFPPGNASSTAGELYSGTSTECLPDVLVPGGLPTTTTATTTTILEGPTQDGYCINKPISVTDCRYLPGLITNGTSTGGNPQYIWPQYESGLSEDYNLVEIAGQCWFAENLQEHPAGSISSPVYQRGGIDTGFYGLYEDLDGAGNGSDIPPMTDHDEREGFIYQWSGAMNGASEEGAQGACPAGWHIPTDCEWSWMEYHLGMDVSDLDSYTSNRDSGSVGQQLKWGGSSGFEALLHGQDDNNWDQRGEYFESRGQTGWWWTSAENTSKRGVGSISPYSNIELNTVFEPLFPNPAYPYADGVGRSGGGNPSYGHAVRCLLSAVDRTVNEIQETSTTTRTSGGGVQGCTDSSAQNYNPQATVDDGSCDYDPENIYGCTMPQAQNYNPQATEDDGSCVPHVLGCMDPAAVNYNEDATMNNGTCIYDCPPGQPGCDSTGSNDCTAESTCFATDNRSDYCQSNGGQTQTWRVKEGQSEERTRQGDTGSCMVEDEDGNDVDVKDACECTYTFECPEQDNSTTTTTGSASEDPAKDQTTGEDGNEECEALCPGEEKDSSIAGGDCLVSFGPLSEDKEDANNIAESEDLCTTDDQAENADFKCSDQMYCEIQGGGNDGPPSGVSKVNADHDDTKCWCVAGSFDAQFDGQDINGKDIANNYGVSFSYGDIDFEDEQDDDGMKPTGTEYECEATAECGADGIVTMTGAKCSCKNGYEEDGNGACEKVGCTTQDDPNYDSTAVVHDESQCFGSSCDCYGYYWDDYVCGDWYYECSYGYGCDCNDELNWDDDYCGYYVDECGSSCDCNDELNWDDDYCGGDYVSACGGSSDDW